jgi:maleate isomerase
MRLDFELDRQPIYRATLGLIVLEADETIEAEIHRLLPDPAVRILVSRVACTPEITPDTLPEMLRTLPDAARRLPSAAGIDAVGYACTSAASVLGETTVTELITGVLPDMPVTNPLTALKAACRALGVQRIAIVSPYVEDVAGALNRALEESGVDVAAFGSFGEKEERVVARISPASIRNAMMEVGASRDCDAVFASCTNLRATGVLGDVERDLGIPALASNQVMAWHLARLAGLDGETGGGGRLARLPLATG